MEEVVVGNEKITEQSPEVQEPQVASEGVVTEEEGVITLPSDVTEFTMPEKFEGKSAEEIAKSYIELEKFKGETPTVETPSNDKPTEDAPQGNKFVKEYLESGELSEASYKELSDQGLDKAEVDSRLEYEKYKNQKAIDDVVSVIGGVDNYTAMNEWAAENIEAGLLAQYTEELGTASKFGKQAILKDIYSQYKASQAGEAPEFTTVHTNEGQVTVGKGYTSQHELQADMSDKRYGTDRSYTEAVEKKLAKSKNF